jgi:prefoldin subunit 5
MSKKIEKAEPANKDQIENLKRNIESIQESINELQI